MLNRVTIQGNVTRDPETRFSQSGTKITRFGLAWNTRNANKEEEVHFYNVCVMGQTADFVDEYVKKGSGIIVDGELRNNRWETESGEKRSTYEIFVGFRGSVNFTNSRRTEGEAETATAGAASTEGAASSKDDIYF